MALATVAYAATATVPSCTVDRLDTDGNRIALWCVGDPTAFYAFRSGWTGNTACGSVTVDTMKMWLSQAQSALLSGKPLFLIYTVPAGPCVDKALTSVGLKR